MLHNFSDVCNRDKSIVLWAEKNFGASLGVWGNTLPKILKIKYHRVAVNAFPGIINHGLKYVALIMFLC